MRPAAPFALCLAAVLAAAPARAAEPAADPAQAASPQPDDAEARRKPGEQPSYPVPTVQVNPGAVETPPPESFPTDQLPIPDRWRLIETLGLAHSRWFDPYNQNTLKGDRPIKGTKDWFFVLSGISDTVVEPRSFPTPVGVQTTSRPGSLDVFGRARSMAASQTFLVGAELIKGATTFKPPEIELRASLAFNYNYVTVSERRILSVKPTAPPRRSEAFIGVQELFLDYHLRNVSARYDFDTLRLGIQPFSTDFRGFLFQDNQLGVRLFGTRDNNRYQYNLAAFARLEKDTNSGLNDLTQKVRRDYVAAANLYRQDLPVPGFTSQVTLVYNANREAGEIHVDTNGFPARPALIGDIRARDYDVAYLGYNGDGHFGRLNLTASAYFAFGEDRDSIFTNRPARIRAWFVAAEPAMDFDWVRVRLSGLYASGDRNPNDNVETGFDAIFENPQFAGADTSYWIRQSIPFAGGGRALGVNGRNAILNALRSSKEEGQSNFNNPGTALLGVGADFDLLPTLRLSANFNQLWFADTAVLQTLRQEGSIPRRIGGDYSLAVIWRPRMTQNLVYRLSAAALAPGPGFGHLFTTSRGGRAYYSVLLEAVAAF